MFGIFKKALKEAAKDASNRQIKADNVQLMTAMINAATLVAYADGTLDDHEVESVSGLIKASPMLEVFGSEPTQLFDAKCKEFEAGFRMGKLNALRALKVITDHEEAETVLVMAIEVGFSGGEAGEDELKILDQIADVLKLKVDDYI